MTNYKTLAPYLGRFRIWIRMSLKLAAFCVGQRSRHFLVFKGRTGNNSMMLHCDCRGRAKMPGVLGACAAGRLSSDPEYKMQNKAIRIQVCTSLCCHSGEETYQSEREAFQGKVSQLFQASGE